ncbi:alpha-1,4-glucan--maltose-1-phosphate maltosyltransferase [Nocardioides sp. ChNu-153]|uniref:alpha-1,4-glucan--maltose-1-phosphate maltosyltransferase n=1 Tax=unclassified Nocardioides TaxID=2615069 RepID=UPI0024076666|nr:MULTISPECIES: alpha-1,4-glucan--maltose-1-phosphate maltosyltransferase [unclassified Nocardioides]MDF9715563.1 alpha-1,4-glucan--maltose-1-phosphate maltosyltransferase [Nocardioides sp. ChNu-99]MDN7120682.1 alpha-1,4-glucan--maltose-1-phosphate maltosyltransferase [Nocardioides sp. ChNu-153]
MVGRIPVMNVAPVVDLGRQPAKATVGEPFPVTATVFREGHDRLGAEVVLTDPAGVRRPPVPLEPHPVEPNEYAAWVTPDTEGPWTFTIQAWSHPIATWQHAAGVKIPAEVDVDLMFTEGRLLLERVLAEGGLTAAETEVLQGALAVTTDDSSPATQRLSQLEAPEVRAVLAAHPLRELVTLEGPFPFFADRTRALFGSWYEFFPRSEGAYVDDDGKVVSGTLRTAAQRLDAVAAAGFDVIYLPPIHPIGEVNRKGPNNTLTPGPDDPGSPWAIGSRHGGHDAVHPDLGTVEDLDAFVARARELGLEVALDLALQAAPDHPWVTTNPEFFTTRADGTIAYAENPPKKYQDIYPINFDNDPTGICREVLRVVKHWMRHGVRIFRVDNPHTKPVAFWEWLLAEVRRTDPDVLFLAEAFTKPAMMRGLGAVGFHQSYTYFTWRTAKWEIEDYLRELSTETDHVMRPNFFVNTPDILHAFLQYGGPAAFKIRAALAATSSPTWGVYAGYELFEHVAVKPGSEEYLDSEKYQVRIRDWDRAEAEGRTLTPYLTRLNELRRDHRALQLLRNITIHHSDDENVIVYSKRAPGAGPDGTDDVVIVVINLDPHATRETTVHLDMPSLGLDWAEAFEVTDAFTGETWTWREHDYVRLDPSHEPAHVLTVRSLR